MSDSQGQPEAQTGTIERITVQTPESMTQEVTTFPPTEDANPSEITDAVTDLDPSDPSAEEGGNKPPRGVQKRLDELTREKYESRRQLEATQAQLDRAMQMLERQMGGQSPQEPAPQIDPNAPPDPDNYTAGEFDPGYLRDLAKFEVRQELMAEREQAQRMETVRQIRERETAARAKYNDYDQVVHVQTLAPIAEYNPMLLPMLAEHESGPDLAYYLGKNPEEVVRLAQMHPMQAAIRIGQLAAHIAPPERSSGQTAQRKAPAPISPVSGAGNAPAASIDAQLAELEAKGDYDTWRRLKKAQKG